MSRKDQLSTMRVKMIRSEQRDNIPGKLGMEACIEFVDKQDTASF